jgi:hypothetical protein
LPPALKQPALSKLLSSALPGASKEALESLELAMSWATLEGEDLAEAAARPPVLEAIRDGEDGHEWARLPYPLLAGSRFPSVELLPGFESRPLFVCTTAGRPGEKVLVKFTPRDYPTQVTSGGCGHRVVAGVQSRRKGNSSNIKYDKRPRPTPLGVTPRTDPERVGVSRWQLPA